MRTTRKRVALPFLFRASDGLGANGAIIARSFGAEVEGVFTRAGAAYTIDQSGRLALVPTGLPRFAWHRGELTLWLEGDATNLLLRSEELDNAAWTNVGTPTVSANVWPAPNQTLTADGIIDNSGAELRGRAQAVTVANNSAAYVASVYVRKATAAPTTQFQHLTMAFSGGTPVTCTVALNRFTGAVVRSADAEYATAESFGDYWRLWVTGSNNSSGNTTCTVSCYPAGADTLSATPSVSGTGEDVGHWGSMLNTGRQPSSYKPTTSASAARAADGLYFPFRLPPAEMTIYVRGIERTRTDVAAAATGRVLHIGAAANSDPRLLLYRASGETGYRFQHDPGTGVETSNIGSAAQGDLVELRGVLGATGTATLGVSVNGGAETTNGPSSASALADAWSDARLYLNSVGTSSYGAFGYTHVAVALGTKTLAEMRELAEVG